MLDLASRAEAADDLVHPSHDPLRIAVVAPPWYELPPVGYGGIESMVADLVDQLVGRGHDVTLIGAGRNRTRASRFVPVFERPPSERLGAPVPEVLHAAAAAAALRDLDVDIVHDHSLAGPLLAPGRTVPTLVTTHGPVDGELGDYYRTLGADIDVAAISDAQRRLNPRLNWIGTVPNAIDVGTFPFRAVKDDYVLWLGRFCADKGPHLAIDIARAAGVHLVLAGKCSEPPERAYFDREIAPRLGAGVTHVGEADARRKRELLSGARALLFPIQWDEPFGMVMIEALACGTPVVATGRGSVPEIVDPGRTGFVLDGPDEFPAALARLGELDPVACRRAAEQRFDLPVMARGYEQLYRTLVDARRGADRRTASLDGTGERPAA